ARGPCVLLGLLLGLGATRVQGECQPPDRLPYAEPREDISTSKSFPAGATVFYNCRPGYMGIPGRSLALTCGEDSQWSPTEPFCTARKCSHPGELENGVVHVTGLAFGSKATFSCQEGYRLVGVKEISCVIEGDGVAWSKALPYCERIPCEPPPEIANGHYTERPEYRYQTTVTYTCDDVPKGTDPFSLIGPASIFCTHDADFNGVWSGPPPQCKVVKCENPRVENGRKISGLALSYSYRDSVEFMCNEGYVMNGAAIITCEEDSAWSPPKPTCEKVTEVVCAAPKITNGVVVPAKAVYGQGEAVQLRCNAYCTFPDDRREMTVTCRGQNAWSSLQNCTCGPESVDSTPHISHGRVIEGQKPVYSVGDFITIECYSGYTLHGEARIQYTGQNQWTPEVPTCHLSAYITAIICVIVAVVVCLAAFWVYKKFFSQNG
ncbi:CR1L protein, partial [Rhinopomastus cyanomelas]|nr:CR1L protein [Rhinopomastus cyanomelas]